VNLLEEQLNDMLLRCHHALQQVMPKDGHESGQSDATKRDYLRLGTSLIMRARYTENGLADVVPNTTRPTTFYKRLAALRYCLQIRQLDIQNALVGPMTMVQLRNLLRNLTDQHEHLTVLLTLQNQGLKSPRKKRNSKRQALSGLPKNWREVICKRGKIGKYGVAMLVAALTGCRPAELQRGVKVWRAFDNDRKLHLIHFEINGAKVKAGQGQPSRHLAYTQHDVHPLVVMLNQVLPSLDDGTLHVQIEKPVNFTTEVRRLANSLWPKHPHTVTPYCFRHQWASDAKRVGTVDSVSQGLGHVSTKTQRNYGTASQGSSSTALRPVIVEAERPIRHVAMRHQPARQDDSEPSW